MSFDLFFPAILVFALMLVGVVLTVLEFNKLQREEREQYSGKGGGDNHKNKR